MKTDTSVPFQKVARLLDDIELPGYDESGKGSWPQSLDQVFKSRLDKDNQAVGEGEEVGHPPRVLRVAVLRPDLVVGGDQGAVAPGRAQVGRRLCKEVVVVDKNRLRPGVDVEEEGEEKEQEQAEL